MAYFYLCCCTPALSNIVLLVLNIIIIAIGAAHFGYASQLNKTKQAILLYIPPNEHPQPIASAIPPMAYYIAGSIVQILTSILVILVLFDFLGKQNRLRWFRLLAFLVILTFAINFCMAVHASVTAAYYEAIFDNALNIPDQVYKTLPPIPKGVVDNQITLYKYTVAEAFYTWLLAVPCIGVVVISLINQFVNEDTVSGSRKVAPGEQSSIQMQPLGQNSNAIIKESR